MATDGATLTPTSKVRAGGDTDTDDGSSDSSPDSSDGVVSEVPALSPSLPWYRRGGLHVLEPSHGLVLAAVYFTLFRELLGPSWGGLHSAYVVVVICCLLHGRLPRGAVSDARWFFCCVVMPIYFASVPLVFALPAPALSLLAALVLLILKVFAPRYCSLCALPANPPCEPIGRGLHVRLPPPLRCARRLQVRASHVARHPVDRMPRQPGSQPPRPPSPHHGTSPTAAAS